MNIIYSFNKRGNKAECWQKEIAMASNDEFTFIPFNHDPYLDHNKYMHSQQLDDLYQGRHPGLLKMYADFESAIRKHNANAVIVTNCPPYHPEFLRKLKVYKVLYTTDDPVATYARTIPYLHAYDHVFHHDVAHSADLDMAEKMRYSGMVNVDFVPLGVFDHAYDTSVTAETLLGHERDIDVIFIGSAYLNKMPILGAMKKAFGRHLVMHGIYSWKKNVYFNVKYGFPGWIVPIKFEDYVPLYQRAKIGFNVHNRGKYGIGSYRLFDLPANGVMQISDGGEYLGRYFDVDNEVIGYENTDELISKVKYYLDHDDERKIVARNGYKRAMADYRFVEVTRRCGLLIKQGMERIGWQKLVDSEYRQ